MRQRIKLVFNLAGRRTGKLRRESLQGRTHLVVPCTMLVEGVVEGSGGPLLYLNEENGRDPDSWNHMPVVVYHPKKDGSLISAKHPDVANTHQIGLLFNTKHESNKLQTEVWADEERTKEVDPRVYEAIVNEQPMEVSTGLSMDVEEKEGKWTDGKDYKGIARNHRPDHLAVLPDQKGACSIADGGGLYANSSVEKPADDEVWVGNSAGSAVVNDTSLQQTMSQVCQALYDKFQKPGYSWNGWVEDVFDGYVVYYSDRKLWAVNYSMKDGKVTITSEPIEVVRNVTYKKASGGEVVGNSSAWQFVPFKETVTMAAPAGFDKNAHITSLIGNGWTEEDRAFLTGLPDEKLAKVKPITPTMPAPTLNPGATPPITGNATPPVPVAGTNGTVTYQPAPGSTLSDSERKMFNRLLANEQGRKNVLIQRIVNAQAALNLAPQQRFTVEFLTNKEPEELEAWVVSLEAGVNAAQQAQQGGFGMFQNPNLIGGGTFPEIGGAPIYAGAGGPPAPVGNAAWGHHPGLVCNEEPPTMPHMDFSDHNNNRK